MKDFLVKNKAYLLAFFIPAALLFGAYILFGVYPFGQKSVLALDLNAQYVCYYDYMYDVLAGKESLLYCWSGSLSGEFAGTFAYYLASPFNFIIWLFPRENITEGILTMLLVKASATGLSAAFFFKKHRGYSDLTTICFSVMFALCGYFAAHTINPMWLDGLISLPLVIMGIERVAEKKGFLLYTLSLLYIFIANYYIGYMVGIFSALYFIYYIASRTIGGVKEYLKAGGVFALSSVSAILMSGFIIIPVYKSLQNGKILHDADFSFVENFNIADSFIKLFAGVYDTERPDGLPMLYCGTLALIFAAVYFFSREIPLRKRIAGGFLLGVMTLSMYIKPVDMLWHGGHVPVWMPFRYSFVIIFLLISFGAEAFENIRSVKLKSIGAAFGVLLGILLLCDYIPGGEHFDTKLIIVVPLVVLGIMAAFAAAYKAFGDKLAIKIAVCAAVCVELFVNTSIYIFEIHKDVYYSDRSTYTEEIPATRNIVKQIKESDDGFYRLEKTYHRTVNDAMATGIYGFSHSTSTYNTKALKMLSALGFGARDHYSRYDGATMLTDDIFGVRYVIAKDKRTVPYEDIFPAANQIDAKVYENKDAFNIALLADEGIIGSDIYFASPFMFQQSLAQNIEGGSRKFFTPIEDIIFDSKNVNAGSTTDGHISYKKRSQNDEASVSFTVTTPKSGRVYFYFPSGYERECSLYINDSYLKNYFKNENHCVIYAGEYDEGEEFTVELRLKEDSVYFKDPEFFVLDENELAEFTKAVNSQKCEVKLVSRTELEITVETNEAKALFTTIPAEEGWSAEMDGESCPTASAINETLLCVDVPAGKHTIRLKFFPAGLKTGIILSIVGAVILAAMIAIKFLLPKRQKSEN